MRLTVVWWLRANDVCIAKVRYSSWLAHVLPLFVRFLGFAEYGMYSRMELVEW